MTEIYSKDSFDRFGDDLSELVLSYLTFEDQIRLECVSKQWKRLVFSPIYPKELIIGSKLSEFVIIFGNRHKVVDLATIESILRKCQNIGSIHVIEDLKNEEIMNRVFELIVKYCLNLTQIQSDFDGLTQKTIKDFSISLDQI